MLDSVRRKDLLEEAIRAIPGGRQQDLADAMTAAGLPTIQQHISKYINGDRLITAEVAIAVHRATRGIVPASALRPDLWQTPEHVPIAPVEDGDIAAGGASVSPSATERDKAAVA